MPSTSLVNLSSLIDDAKCYALVRAGALARRRPLPRYAAAPG